MTSKLGWKTNPSSPRYISYISYILYTVYIYISWYTLSAIQDCHAYSQIIRRPKPPRPRCGWAKLHWCIRTMAYVPFENAHMPGPPKQIRQMISNDHGSSRHFQKDLRLVNQRLYYRVMSLILRHPPCKAHLWCMPGHSATHARGHCRIKRLRDHIQPKKKMPLHTVHC